jgi:hypothetical protein
MKSHFKTMNIQEQSSVQEENKKNKKKLELKSILSSKMTDGFSKISK